MTTKQVMNIHEMSLIDLAYQILKQNSNNEPISFKAMFREVSNQLGLSDDEIKDKIVQFYTDLNIDGRFICIGDNQWGLCEWYPFEKMEDDIITASKPKRKKSKSVSDDGFDLLEEDAYEEDFEEADFDEEADMDGDGLGIDDDLDLEEVDELDEGFILEDDNELDEDEEDLDMEEDNDR